LGLVYKEDQTQNYDPGRTSYTHSSHHNVFCELYQSALIWLATKN